jgi:SAM-dependent methyltransferase
MLALGDLSDQITEPGFQPSRYVDDTSQCLFYHSMELPGLGLQNGSWDLRADVEDYLGKQKFSGKRVVDVGTASGYLAFEMEKRGADVIALDRLLGTPLDEMGLVPFEDFERRFGATLEQSVYDRVDHHLKLQNSFWLSHRLLKSKVRLYCGNAYNCPSELGQFDYAFFGAILLHLRDPLQALTSFARATREKIIITEPWEDIAHLSEMPVMMLRPNVQDQTNPGTWWYLPPGMVRRFLEILGFRKFDLRYHEACLLPAQMVKFYTLVASR